MTAALLAILTASALSQSTPAAQPNDAQPATRSAEGRDHDRSPRPERGPWPGGRRAMLEYIQAGPDQRRDMRVNGIVRMLERTYDLDPAQTQTVTDEVRKMQREYYASLGDDAAELDKLETKMHDFWTKQSATSRPARGRRLMRDPEFRSISHRLWEIRLNHPFDFEQAVARVEALLPADQVAKGRERREQFRRRMDDFRRDRAQTPNRRRRDADTPRPPAAQTETNAKPAPIIEQPKHPWEVYANEFATRHPLTAVQQAAARSIVKDLIARDTAYQASHAAELAAVARAEPGPDRDTQRKQHEAPTQDMFNELKSRLDDLLTTDQRKEK